MPLHSRVMVFVGACFFVTASYADWQLQAIRLSGENETVRTQALNALTRDPQLVGRLKKAVQLTSKPAELRSRALALDVIHAANLATLTPQLWQSAINFDPGGQALLTALALSPEPLAPWIPERLWGMVADESRPLTNRWAALESLSRVSSWIWLPRHAAYLARAAPLLRWGGLTALRIQVLRQGRARDIDLIEPFLHGSDPELKLRARQILVERTGASPEYPMASIPAIDLPEGTLSVFFGYKDSRPNRYVADRIEAAYWIEKKLAQGWRVQKKNKNLIPVILERENSSAQVAVWFSSVGPDDAMNRKDRYQDYWSARVSGAFEQALKHSAVVTYVGHSRDGGGPDFAPPLLDPSGHVNYAAYPKAKTLQNIGAQIRFLGLYSCASRQHFSGLLSRKIPKAKLDLSGELIYWTDALEALDQGLTPATRTR